MSTKQQTIRVKPVLHRKRRQYVLRWTDPETGAQKQQKAEATTRTEAIKEAGRLEQQLAEGRYDDSGRVRWSYARQRFEEERLPQLREATRRKYRDVLKEIEREVRPVKLSDLDASKVSIFQSRQLKRGLSVATVGSRLGHLKAYLNWCHEVGLLASVPRIKKPSMRGHGKKMRGRPLTDGEFALMLEATEKVVGPETAPTWRHYLEGLWLSGLRRTESLDLFWDSQHALWVDLSGRRPMLGVSAEYEKGGKDRRVPITPDFAEFLLRTPEDQRVGRVFALPGRGGVPGALSDWVGRVVSRIGKKSGVVVDERGNRKHATAHDLRRSFAARWADRVHVNVLRQLMRHATIETTLSYYVGQDEDRAAEAIWGYRTPEQPNAWEPGTTPPVTVADPFESR